MKNVEWGLEADILTIRVDLSQTFGSSSSGKTTNREHGRQCDGRIRPRRKDWAEWVSATERIELAVDSVR